MSKSLEERVMAAAGAAVGRQKYVAPIDVLIGVGWLRPERAEAWRRGRAPYLERVTEASLGKLGTALGTLRRWAEHSGLQPRETVYVSWTPDRHRLRFSKSGDENVERAYRTHWISPQLIAAKGESRANRARAECPAVAPPRPGGLGGGGHVEHGTVRDDP
jgi:hypothetical protein